MYKIESPASEIFLKYFDINTFILKVCGVWVPDKKEPFHKRWLQLIYNFVLNFYCLCIYQPMECAVLFASLNLNIFVRSLRDQFNHHICVYKIIRWFSYRKEIMEILTILKRNQYVYEDYEDFKCESIVKFHKKRADRWMLLFLFFVNFICFNMLLSVLYIIIFKYEDLYFINEEGRKIYGQKLPASLLTPFKMETRQSFIFHFIFEIFALDIYAWMIVGLDGLFTSLISCVSANFCILQGAFRTIRPRCMKRLGLKYEETLHDSDELNAEMLKEFKTCSKHLQLIIDLSNRLEKIYNMQTGCQVMVSLFEMCFCLYLLSTNLDEGMGPELTYLMSTSFELLLYCWFGNGIIEASSGIPDAIYKGDWLSSTTSFKKSMLITMTRLKKPIYITIGKFMPLTFTTFLSITRVAYSFFTVLRSEAFQ